LHKSGTSLVAGCLAGHPSISDSMEVWLHFLVAYATATGCLVTMTKLASGKSA
jgi:hypothetical protein